LYWFTLFLLLFLLSKGPSTDALDAPQPKAYCATLSTSFSTSSLSLCILRRDIGLLIKPCLYLLVQQTDPQRDYSTHEPASRSNK
jgi:hypothetical protein